MMRVARPRRRLVRFGRLPSLAAVSAIGAIVIMSVAAGAVGVAEAAPTASCTPGSGPHLAGKRLTAGQLSSYSSLECADLAGSNLSGQSLLQIDLTGANLKNANLSGDNLEQATLSGANLAGADLRGADMTQATMNGVNLAGADARAAKFGQATMTGANLSGAQLQGADFTQTTLSNAQLVGANLTKATLDEATANDANFSRANLTNADFSSATLSGAKFTKATLTGTSFDGATGGPSTGGVAGLTSGFSVNKGQWSLYLLGFCIAIFVAMVSATIRRFFVSRAYGLAGPVASAFGGGAFAGPGGSFGPGGGFSPAGGFGGTAADGVYNPIPGNAFGGAPGPVGGPYNQPAPTYGRGQGSGNPAGRLVLGILGALIVAGGLWLMGTEILDVISSGSNAVSHIGGATVFIIVAVFMVVIGIILRAVGRFRTAYSY